jgi:hypothetical protein
MDLFHHAMDNARKNAGELEGPEDDIMPIFLWLGPYGMGLMPMLGMRDGRAKDRLAGAMEAVLVVSRATEAAFVSTSWMVAVKSDESGTGPAKWDGVIPSEHPDRQEVITVMHHGESGVAAFGQAPVTRHPDRPPELGRWETMQREGIKMGGRFGEAIDHGLRVVQELPPEMLEVIEAAWADGQQEDLMRTFLKVFGQFTGLTGIGITSQPIDSGREITPRRMSDIYKIPLRTIYEVCKSGVLPATRAKGKWLIDELDAAEYAAGYQLRREEMGRDEGRRGDDGS